MVQVIFGLFGHKLSPKTFISKTEKTWPGLGKLRQTVRLIEEWKDCNNKVWLALLFDLRFFFSTALILYLFYSLSLPSTARLLLCPNPCTARLECTEERGRVKFACYECTKWDMV